MPLLTTRVIRADNQELISPALQGRQELHRKLQRN